MKICELWKRRSVEKGNRDLNDEGRIPNDERNPKSELPIRNLEPSGEPIEYLCFVILSAFVIRISSSFRASNPRPSTHVNDLRGAVRQPVKNPGFTVHT